MTGDTTGEDLGPGAEDEAEALLWDVGSSGSLDGLRAAATRVPVVAVLWSEEQAREALAAGAHGVLLRGGLEEQLGPAVLAAVA
ncbi:MAG TPA: hypothetical protein VLB47_00990, partial [Solirubrobacteraceae bacterium]|nr:hypothetical protein [Solirubrobacteraceae bacterium]